jgi:cell fate regulator YaaT (PSP1 superfamily)
MPIVVGVVFKKAGKIYYFDPAKLELNVGDGVIVKTARGMEYGEVVSPPEQLSDEEIITPLKKISRKATKEDKEKATKNRVKEKEALKTCEEKIAEHNLPMKLVDVEYVFDGSKMIFYFTAEGRVDFRDLVKDLASVFRTRIELRQIGVRDEAKMIGGLGPCGRRLCCTLFLSDFEPVSIKMAKEQNLPLNPLKISGVCGRLMCCLRYENEVYKDFNKRAPRRGSEVETPEGHGKVVDYCVPREKVVVAIGEGSLIEFPLTEVTVIKKPAKAAKEKTGAKDKAEEE